MCTALVFALGAKLSTFGAASGCFIISFSSAFSILLAKRVFLRTTTGAEDLIWVQMFLIVLVGMSHFYTSLLVKLRRHKQRLRQDNEAIEKEVQHRTSELKKARDLAEASSRDKLKFLAFLCHELR